MATSKEFVEYTLDLLAPVGSIHTTRMFGGVLLKVNGVQLGVIFSETFYFKVTDLKMQKEYKEMGSMQFTYTRKDKKDPVVIKKWWSVPEKAMDNSDEMVSLAEAVLSGESSV